MFEKFSHRHTVCTVDGAADKVIFSRETKATSIEGKEYMFNGVFAPTSGVVNGSMVIATDSFLVLTKRSTVDGDKYCSLIKTNDVIIVQRYSQAYDSNGNESGNPIFTAVQSNVKANSQYVSARMRQEDIGLLASTVYVLHLQNTVDIKRPQDASLKSPDRIILNGRSYQVDVVDDVKLPNLYYVQLSEDFR